MVKPLVSIITPTWQRHEKLINRCIPSVQSQIYQRVEHVIVSDGPDDELTAKMAELSAGTTFYHPVRFLALNPRPEGHHWGHWARLAGIAAASGSFIGYIDDDDSLRPEHIQIHMDAMTRHNADWTYSQMASHSNSGLSTYIGTEPPYSGQIGTPMIMHRRGTLEHGTWGPASSTEDWELVQRWMNAGARWHYIPEPTVDVWPSAYWG